MEGKGDRYFQINKREVGQLSQDIPQASPSERRQKTASIDLTKQPSPKRKGSSSHVPPSPPGNLLPRPNGGPAAKEEFSSEVPHDRDEMMTSRFSKERGIEMGRGRGNSGIGGDVVAGPIGREISSAGEA